MLSAKDDESGDVLTDSQMHGHTFTFMLAGHETTSVALSWLFYVLAKYPEVEEKLIKEIQTIIPNGQEVNADIVDKMPYLNNVIKETLRLYPPIPIAAGRKPIEDDFIGGYKIPKGTKILVCPLIQHRLETYWKNPDTFDPDRWNNSQSDQFAYMPFLIGNHQCIGNRFAMLEIKIIVAILLSKFHLKILPGLEIKKKLSLSMRPHPLKMTVHPRQL